MYDTLIYTLIFVFCVIKITIKFYFLFIITAIGSGYYIYYDAIKNKKTFTLNQKINYTIPDVFPIRKMLLDIHSNITFFIIYSRVNNEPIFKFKKFIILSYRFLFLYLTGVNWFVFTIINKLIKYNTIDPKILIFNENNLFTVSNKILFVKGGKWYSNNKFKAMLYNLQEIMAARGMDKQDIKSMMEHLTHIWCNKQPVKQKIPKNFILTKASLSNNPKIGKHFVSKQLMKNKYDMAWFTDYYKAIKNNNYDNEVLLHRIDFKKPTSVIIKKTDDLLIDKNIFIPIEADTLLYGCIRYGCNPNALEDDFHEAYISHKIFSEEMNEFADKWLIEDEIKTQIIKLHIIESYDITELK